ncbi:hypothetical protein BKA80DRAFT_129840 [Phyllosticta citrichinensis]
MVEALRLSDSRVNPHNQRPTLHLPLQLTAKIMSRLARHVFCTYPDPEKKEKRKRMQTMCTVQRLDPTDALAFRFLPRVDEDIYEVGASVLAYSRLAHRGDDGGRERRGEKRCLGVCVKGVSCVIAWHRITCVLSSLEPWLALRKSSRHPPLAEDTSKAGE